ncbi:hypothetical protein [Aromatoleum anaerobium]|uniref:Uncharacterized protein n=1 Tax=Aromatoleum anaerobium TaxID=182180 RepID=A0ABX1PSX5_9RHOO|nr:hypothetical protein [Aromatoleum anaerobium]MCK0508619.1 hypothetical protein [Aromatoleum anaerobium]
MDRVTAITLLLLATPVSATHPDPTHPDPVRLARYTTAPATPDPAMADPMAVVATVHFPREHVRTVRDAVAFLLLRTGFRLESTDLAASALLDMPLPESHRDLGPYPARAILEVLVGPPYRVQISLVDRTLSIGLTDEGSNAERVAAVRPPLAPQAATLEPLK